MNILFFGPIPPPYHGQSIAFHKALEINALKKIVININLTGSGLLKKIFLSVSIFLKLIYNFFFSEKPDIIYFTCSRSLSGSLRDIILLKLAGFYSIPVVNHLHGTDFKDFFNSTYSWHRYLLKSSYKNVSASIVLTERMLDQFEMFPNMPVYIVSNFYSSEIGFKEEKDFLGKNSEIEFLFLSNIMQTKGIFLLIDAFKELCLKYKNIKLKIAGDFIGDYELDQKKTKKKFFEEIKELSNVEYLGIVSGNKKINLLKKSSILVLPSYHKSEAIPLSIIEAMASGCAVITSNHNYLPDLVGSENGFLIEPNNLKSLISVMDIYLRSPILLEKHQRNNITHAVRNFSEKKYLSSLENKLVKTLQQVKH